MALMSIGAGILISRTSGSGRATGTTCLGLAHAFSFSTALRRADALLLARPRVTGF